MKVTKPPEEEPGGRSFHVAEPAEDAPPPPFQHAVILTRNTALESARGALGAVLRFSVLR